MSSETSPNSANLAAWPGAFGAYKLSKNAVLVNVWTIVALTVIVYAVSLLLEPLAKAAHIPLVYAQVASFLLGLWVGVALIIASLASARHAKISVGKSLQDALPYTFKYFLLSILTMLLAIVSLLLFIVPFFFVAPRLMLSPYYLVDKKLGPVDALKASWHASKGNVGKIWGIIGVSFLFGLLCLVLVGIYFSIMYTAVVAIFYLYLSRHKASS